MTDPNAVMLPEITPEAEPYWRAANEGKLTYQRCRNCGDIQFPFQTICRHCLSDRLEVADSCGRAEILSFTTIYRAPSPSFADDVPYTVILARLDEGFVMMSSLVETPPEDVQIGQRAQVTFKRLNGELALPCFRIVAEDS